MTLACALRLGVTALTFVMVATVHTPRLWAQSGNDAAIAESLREEGSRLLKQGKVEEACVKLKASIDMRKSVFTSGKLAQCYEQLGKLASAWIQWRATVVMIGASSDPLDQQRKRVAKQKAVDLDPKVPRLVIDVGPDRDANLEVRRNGELVVAAIWGSAVRVDAGTYDISALAPGRTPWSATVVVVDGETKHVEIPTLATASGEDTSGSSTLDRSWSTQSKVAVGVGALGIALVGTGTVFGLSARSKRGDARSLGCTTGNVCPTQEGVDLLDSARARANVSTVTFVAGAGAIGLGVFLYVTATRSRESTDVGTASATRIEPALSPEMIGVNIGGAF